MATYASKSPGVYLEDVPQAQPTEFNTGVPVFLGSVAALPSSVPVDAGIARLDVPTWAQLENQEQETAVSWASGHLGPAVRGFFQNGGQLCYVVHIDGASALDGALAVLESSTAFDLVCAPGLADLDAADLAGAQARILRFCAERGDCFAILDSVKNNLASKGLLIQGAKAHRDALAAAIITAADAAGMDRESLRINGALYFSWLKVRGSAGVPDGFVPPSGHVAGIYARIDQSQGFYKAPANEALEGVFDLQAALGASDQEGFISTGTPNVNCLRAFPGRGIRIWGARTLSLRSSWLYINVRRTVMTVHRWLEIMMTDYLFEPNESRLWIRINRDVGAFLDELHRRGALQGRTASEAYFVKCDAENNPQAVRDAGQVVVEVGLAAATPREFLVVRLIHGADGLVSVSAGPGAP